MDLETKISEIIREEVKAAMAVVLQDYRPKKEKPPTMNVRQAAAYGDWWQT